MSIAERRRKIHFVGIGGIGMSGLAEILLELGNEVSGSDLAGSDIVERLKSKGARIQKGHDGAIVESQRPDVVVFSTAVSKENAELAAARRLGVPVIRRAEMLSEIMRLKRGIAIAGSHGKTTTTGLTSLVLKKAGLNPTVVIGGRFDAIGSNAALGLGAWMVAEADESDGSFLKLSPELSVVTNIDPEHLDHWGSFDRVVQGFEEFLDRLPFYGRAFLNSDCPNLRKMRGRLGKPALWYGTDPVGQPDFRIEVVEDTATPLFRVIESASGSTWLEARLSVPGLHNVSNATAAALVGRELGLEPATIASALADFRGVARRFERKGEWRGHAIIEDYAHHPTEIRATLAASGRAFPGLRPVVVFQPHRFSRTRDMWQEFQACFEPAEHVLTLPIYAASEIREPWVANFDGSSFAAHLTGVVAHPCATQDEVVSALKRLESEGRLAKGAPIFVMGAGDVSKLAPRLASGET